MVSVVYRHRDAETRTSRIELSSTSASNPGAILQEPMPSAFHTFKLVPSPMAPTNSRQPTPILPPSTPNNVSRPASAGVSQHDSANNTPTTETRMNPPPLPRSLMTPQRDLREGSVASSAGSSARKPRQNLEERDHILMVKHCFEQRHNFKEGTKAQFWTGVNTAFQDDTGKILAQMSATVGRLVEARRRQISDWENGIIPQKPGGELNDLLDQWMEFLRTEDGDAEAERMRQVESRRKAEEQRKEARRQAIAAEQVAAAQNPPPLRQIQGPAPATEMGQPAHYPQTGGGQIIQANGEADMNGYRPNKRKRTSDRQLTQDIQAQAHVQAQAQAQYQHEQWVYTQQHAPEPPRRVVVEGAMSKEDWREVMGNDARLRALESKVEKIELLVSQNNKLLLQLVQNQSKESEHNTEEERVPVHLDAEFERDYL
jgi:hypothetical protein